jgi:hypothetical protein
MRESRSSGSVEGVTGNRSSYSDSFDDLGWFSDHQDFTSFGRSPSHQCS